MPSFRDFYLLDPNIIFLNHGSFGACPRPVFRTYQRLQRRMERQPVEFLGRQATGLLAKARARLADFVGASADEVVFFPNPTTAINMVARSLAFRQEQPLQPGDEILASDHEYGAMDRTWRFIAGKTGAVYVRRALPLPVGDPEALVRSFLAGITRRTRVVFISHVTSSTALVFPVKEICRQARAAGLLTIVDGAHAIGQMPLDLTDLGADFYTGACHKWLSAPKGAAFLYARRAVQDWLDPLVVSWGYESERASASRFIDYHEWQGTRDISPYLSVPAAIDFQMKHDWEAVRGRCHALAVETRRRINALTGLEPVCQETWQASDPPHTWFSQMFIARLPQGTEPESLKERLYQDYHIEVPLTRFNDQPLLRVSFQAYNTEADADALFGALGKLL